MALIKVLCWALIFLIRLRFPPGKSIVDILKKRYNGNGSLAAFRKIQRIERKLGKAKLDLTFLTNCKSRGVIPRFLRFKVANRNLRNSPAYYQCQKKLLDEEIRVKNSRIRSLTRESSAAQSSLATLVSSLDLLHLESVCDRENNNVLKRHSAVQERKLFRLTQEASKTTNIKPDEVIFNYSNRILSDDEKSVLVKGLNFSIPPKKLNQCNFMIPFELLYQKIKDETISPLSGLNNDFVKTKMKSIALSGFRSYSPPPFIFTDDEMTVLKSLKNDKSIIIVKPDKGNGLVLLDRSDYDGKMNDILADETKFEKLDEDLVKLTLKRENIIKKFLKELNKKGVISTGQYRDLSPSGSRPGILYGLPKVHKLHIPLRPILSSVRSHSYNIAKFLVSLLRPISNSAYTVYDSFSFVKELLDLKFNTDQVFMASFDITSLFTNIPLDETIDIIIDKTFVNASKFHGFSIFDFRKLLNLAVKNCHFLFNGEVYQQVDGVAMGSPLGPLFANIFLSHHESIWLNDCPSDFKPLFYRRYVDDCFVLFRSRDHVTPFLNYLNTKHTNIKFTHELEVNNSLSFLDINISRKDGCFSTSIYRKPTFTGLLTSFDSFIPLSYKRGLISSLLNRCFHICSTYTIFQTELEKLKQIFIKNGYPTKFIDKCIVSFLDKIFSKSEKLPTVPKRIVYFSLPFTGQHFSQIRTQLRKLLSSAYPQIDIRFISRPSVRLFHFFSFKDKIPMLLRSHVVYEFTCGSCGASYIGETTCHLHTRASNHMGISPLTGKKYSNPQLTSVLSHHRATGHSVSFDNFKILSSCNSKSELLSHETLLIRTFKPSLNANIGTAPLYLL